MIKGSERFESKEQNYRVTKIRASDFKPVIKADVIIPILGYKFIVIGDRMLIGDVSDHTMLAILDKYGVSPTLVETLKDRESKRSTFEAIRAELRGQVTAAGEVDDNGNVIGWKSGGFGIETPQPLRDKLQATIRENISEGGGWSSVDWY